MSIGPPIPEIQHFQNLTLKIKGQRHGWGHSLKSHCGSNILSTHIPFVPCQSSIPFLSYDFFKIWPWKSRVKVMGEVTVQSHNVGVASYRLIYLSFHVDQPSHSWDTAFSKFDLENQGSRLWLRSQFKVTMWVQHPIDSHPFCSMSIGHPIPELWLFQNLTLKIKGQGHGWGHSAKSQCGSSIPSTHIPFVPCQSALPFLRYSIFKIWPWKSRVKVMAHGWGHSSKSQCGSNILSTHIPFVPFQSALPFLRYSIFKIWPWKSRVKVIWPWCCTTTGLDNSIELWMA